MGYYKNQVGYKKYNRQNNAIGQCNIAMQCIRALAKVFKPFEK